MAIRVKKKDWQNEAFRNSILSLAEVLNEDIEIEMPKAKFYPYNVQIWKDDNILKEKDFLKKADAKKWIKNLLSKKKYSGAYADLKKYNRKEDDFDWWFFRFKDNQLIEVYTPEMEL